MQKSHFKIDFLRKFLKTKAKNIVLLGLRRWLCKALMKNIILTTRKTTKPQAGFAQQTNACASKAHAQR
jgi:hypothetical protein